MSMRGTLMGVRVAAAAPARGFATEKQIAMRIVATSNLKKVGLGINATGNLPFAFSTQAQICRCFK